MLARELRLRRTRDISRVHSRGRFAGATDLRVKYLKNGYSVSRLVVIVGKKISKKAVVRNRIRRRIQAELAAGWATVPPGYDIVIMVRADISELPPAELKSRLHQLVKRIPSQ